MNKIINPRSIAILMATYNGSKFLSEQIDSIKNQDNTDWTLYIQDDGSTDNTLDIINSYKDDRIKLIDVGLSHQGPCMNFMSLLNMVESDYYMFCDQDDVWLPHKISISLMRIQKNEIKTKPCLVYTDKTRVDENLNILIKEEYNRIGFEQERIEKILQQRNTRDLILLRATAAGCTMLFNYATKKVAFPFYNVRYQDSVIMLAVSKNNGIISTILEPTMLYRVHSHNTVGCQGDRPLINRVKNFHQMINDNFRAFYLWKIYGGGSLLSFLKAKYHLLKTRFI